MKSSGEKIWSIPIAVLALALMLVGGLVASRRRRVLPAVDIHSSMYKERKILLASLRSEALQLVKAMRAIMQLPTPLMTLLSLLVLY